MQPDLMWAAGFYEGEGSIVCAGGKSLLLTVAQVNVEPLSRLCSIARCGSILPARDGKITIFRCYGLDAQRFAMALFPALSGRRQGQILRALIQYASRRVRDPRRCRRGHLYETAGVYVSPGGGRECMVCRAASKRGAAGPLPALPTAFSARLGVREYVPPRTGTAKAACAWTFDAPADGFALEVQT